MGELQSKSHTRYKYISFIEYSVCYRDHDMFQSYKTTINVLFADTNRKQVWDSPKQHNNTMLLTPQHLI
jgi:hypothetical protein